MDELLARQMPHATEAEQAVIGAMLIDPACVPQVIEVLKPEDFYFEENRRIFETIYSMFTNGLTTDAVTVLEQLKVKGYYDEAGGSAYLAQLMDVTPTAANVLEYAAIVRDKAMLRDVAAAGEEIRGLAFAGGGEAAEIAEIAEQKVYAIRHGREIRGLAHIKDVIMDIYPKLDEMSKNPGKLPGLSTGFHDLDRALTGLNKSDLLLIAARPGMGKTAFALNIALNAAKKSEKAVAVFQLEMSRDQLAERFLASEALLDSQKIKTGNLDEDDWVKIARASSVLSKTKLYIDDNPAITVAEIKAKCRRVEDLGLIVIDYIQLMQSGRRSDNRVQEIAEISRGLKIMAKELNVPVVCLSQLSRAVEQRGGEKRPILSDLRESGAIEQDADVVAFLYRDEYYFPDTEKKNQAELIIAKQRNGPTGTVDLTWMGQYTKFGNFLKKY